MNLPLFRSARVGAPTAALVSEVEILRCPRCSSRMQVTEQILACHGCSQSYPITDGFLQLFVPNDWSDGKLDVTDIVKDFYEETPFPDYDDVDSRETIRQRARLGIFARILMDEQIPFDVLVLEVGGTRCGFKRNRVEFIHRRRQVR
jgi:Trm112p-like protein